MELVDTDVLIDVQRGHPPAIAWFASLATLPALPGFVAMELVQNARSAREVGQALQFVAPFQLVWPSELDCARALIDFANYHPSHGLGLLDSLIAACALGRGATLLTFNAKHYGTVPGLILAQPYVR